MNKPSKKEQIKDKLNEITKKVSAIIDDVDKSKPITKEKITLTYTQSAPLPICTQDERAQAICFVTKYMHLPRIKISPINISEKNNKFYLSDLHLMRYEINELRPIIFNKTDSIYFKKIHKYCRNKLNNADPNRGLSIKVETAQSKQDITKAFLEVLDQNQKTIIDILNNSDFTYIYNGVLQHSDHKYSKRLLEDHHSGELQYILLKHPLLSNHIIEKLEPYFMILYQLNSLRMGSL